MAMESNTIYKNIKRIKLFIICTCSKYICYGIISPNACLNHGFLETKKNKSN